jgi:hypothetical protein
MKKIFLLYIATILFQKTKNSESKKKLEGIYKISKRQILLEKLNNISNAKLLQKKIEIKKNNSSSIWGEVKNNRVPPKYSKNDLWEKLLFLSNNNPESSEKTLEEKIADIKMSDVCCNWLSNINREKNK